MEVLDRVEHDGLAAVLEQVGRGRSRLDDRAARGQVAAQYCDAGVGDQRLAALADDIRVPDRSVAQIVDERLAGDGDRCRVEQVDDLSEDGPQPACPVEVVHEVRAGGLEVDEQRHASADLVEVVQGEINAETSCNREQVNDSVRRAADRSEGHDRVMKRGPCHDGAGAAVGFDELDGQPPGGVGTFEQPAVGGWGAGEPGYHRSERLGEQAHRRGSAHRVAVTSTADHRRLRAIEIILRELAAANLLAEPPHIRAAAQGRAAKGAGEHRATGHDDRGQVDGRRGHEQ